MLNINVFGSSIHFGSPKLRTVADRSCARPLVCALALFAITDAHASERSVHI